MLATIPENDQEEDAARKEPDTGFDDQDELSKDFNLKISSTIEKAPSSGEEQPGKKEKEIKSQQRRLMHIDSNITPLTKDNLKIFNILTSSKKNMFL